MALLVTLLGTHASQWAHRKHLSRCTASILLGPLMVMVVLVLDLPLEVAFLMTRRYSLIPLIPFSVMLAICLCLTRPCCSEAQ